MSNHEPETSPAARLPEAAHPRIHGMFRAAEAVWNEREDLRALYGSIRNPEYWAWLAWHSHAEYPELAALDFAWPPLHLVERVGGVSTDHAVFREGGIVDWRRMVHVLQAAGFNFEGASVLDFGCGPGNLARLAFDGIAQHQRGNALCAGQLGGGGKRGLRRGDDARLAGRL